MRYLKVFLLVLIFFVVMMFFVQNQASFADPVVLKLDLLLIDPIETIPLPLYSVMLICFALGAFIVLLMLMWDRVTLSSRAMSARRRANVLEKKLSKVESELNALLDQLAILSIRNLIFAVADALIGGQPVPVSSGGGGSTSDLPWDGRRPDEEEETYRRRCLLQTSRIVKHTKIRSRNR